MSNSNSEQMAVIEKYERVIDYLYPKIRSTPKIHSVARDKFLECLFDEVDLLIKAGKSDQVSKIYAADGNLQTLRFWVRFFHKEKINRDTS